MEFLLGQCASLFSNNWPLLISFFIAGIAGGFTHCVVMCGSFSLCQTACKSSSCENKPEQVGQFDLKHHVGRAVTYGALGFISALLSKQIAYLSSWPWVAASMLVIAGMLFISKAFSFSEHLFVKANSNVSFIRGALLGFLPCGLLYAALMMSASTANPFNAMVAMWVFVLGTVPSLWLANWVVKMLTHKWQKIMQKFGMVIMLFNGIYLFVMAIKLVR